MRPLLALRFFQQFKNRLFRYLFRCPFFRYSIFRDCDRKGRKRHRLNRCPFFRYSIFRDCDKEGRRRNRLNSCGLFFGQQDQPGNDHGSQYANDHGKNLFPVNACFLTGKQFPEGIRAGDPFGTGCPEGIPECHIHTERNLLRKRRIRADRQSGESAIDHLSQGIKIICGSGGGIAIQDLRRNKPRRSGKASFSGGSNQPCISKDSTPVHPENIIRFDVPVDQSVLM